MARELRRLLIPRERLQAAALGARGGLLVPLNGSEQHYLRRVLRLRDGDPVAVVDGAGNLWSAALVASDRLQLVESLEAPRQRQAPPAPLLQLALALPRRDVELVWRMATELGIDRLQPLRAERCVGIAAQPPLDRWRTVVVEACEQCERLWIPQFAEMAEARGWLAEPLPGEPAESAGGASAGNREGRLLATTRRAGLPLLQGVLRDQPCADQRLVVAVGPEGGWSPAEEEAALAGGWQPVSLGAAILRSGTAAVAAAALLTAWRAQAQPPAAAQFLR
jgi:16S rRNA (uracil1498-N3)-methyltransferase